MASAALQCMSVAGVVYVCMAGHAAHRLLKSPSASSVGFGQPPLLGFGAVMPSVELSAGLLLRQVYVVSGD